MSRTVALLPDVVTDNEFPSQLPGAREEHRERRHQGQMGASNPDLSSALAGRLGAMDPAVRIADDSVVLTVRVKPRASRSRVLAIKAGALEVSVAAAPVDGKANHELIRTLAHEFGLPQTKVEVISGARGRLKVVRLRGVDPARVRGRLGTDM